MPFSLSFLSLLPLLPALLLAQPRPGVEHVLVIGVDGLSPEGIRQSDTPTLDSLMQQGASTLNAQAVMPSSSSPNWASMIMGAPPALHTVTSNDWEPAHIRDSTFCGNEPGQHWPTIFRVLRETYPDADSVRTFDTAATVAYLLGATPPDCWVGHPITSIETAEGYATQPQN